MGLGARNLILGLWCGLGYYIGIMVQRLLISEAKVAVMVNRLCHQVLENHPDMENTVLLGMQPRGVLFAQRVAAQLASLTQAPVLAGKLDVTFFRDDFRRRETPLTPNATDVPFIIEGKHVVLIDDVLFTGRTVRAALDAMIAFGRPASVELMVLVERTYSRELPIEASYIGTSINSSLQERVQVNWRNAGAEQDGIWLLTDAS